MLVRITTAVMRYCSPVIVELIFIFARFQELLSPDTLNEVAEEEVLDGKVAFPYLPDGAGLTDMFLLLDSFPSFLRGLRRRHGLSNACGAFAIHFLICLYHASPILYWRDFGNALNAGGSGMGWKCR